MGCTAALVFSKLDFVSNLKFYVVRSTVRILWVNIIWFNGKFKLHWVINEWDQTLNIQGFFLSNLNLEIGCSTFFIIIYEIFKQSIFKSWNWTFGVWLSQIVSVHFFFFFFVTIWNQIWGVLLSQNISVQTLLCGKQFVIFMWKCNQTGSCKNEVADKKKKKEYPVDVFAHRRRVWSKLHYAKVKQLASPILWVTIK